MGKHNVNFTVSLARIEKNISLTKMADEIKLNLPTFP